MRMKKTTTITAVLLATALIAAACSSKSDGGTNASPSVSAKAGESPAASVKKEKLALTWFVNAANSSQLPAADKDFVKKAIAEKFNVDLKLLYMASGPDYLSKINTMIASGDIPDLFYMDGLESVKYIKDGIAREMTNLVTPEAMPNYFKYWITPTDLKQYQVQNVFKRAPVPYTKKVSRSYYVRKDWLDKLGLKMPETYDEMVTVMKAFTEKDPDGNGKNDTFGFSTSGNGTTLPFDFPEFIKNGLVGDFVLENDQFVDVRTDIRMQKVLDDVRKLLAMNVVDPDWLLNKSGQHIEKATQGKVGIVLSAGGNDAYDNNANGLQVKTKAVTGVANVDWQPFHIGAKTGTWVELLPGNPFLISSKTSEEKAKRSIEILDWLASEEGYLLTQYGLEGVHYKRNGKQIERIEDAYKRDVLDNGNFLSIYNWFANFVQGQTDKFGLEIIDKSITARDKAISEKLKTYKLLPSVGTSLTIKEGMDLATLRKKMSEYHIQILFKEKDASNWPQYRAELMNKYGGKNIFGYYAEQVTQASGKSIKFMSDN
jgi:putative aldouronate transport system substrate-binding protein